MFENISFAPVIPMVFLGCGIIFVIGFIFLYITKKLGKYNFQIEIAGTDQGIICFRRQREFSGPAIEMNNKVRKLLAQIGAQNPTIQATIVQGWWFTDTDSKTVRYQLQIGNKKSKVRNILIPKYTSLCMVLDIYKILPAREEKRVRNERREEANNDECCENIVMQLPEIRCLDDDSSRPNDTIGIIGIGAPPLEKTFHPEKHSNAFVVVGLNPRNHLNSIE